MKDAKLDLRIPGPLKAKAKAYAAASDRSMAWIVIEALKRYLPQDNSGETIMVDHGQELK